MQIKSFFVYKLFLPVNISNFSLFFMQNLDPQQKEGRGGGGVRYSIEGALELRAR